jgi:plastocyanin
MIFVKTMKMLRIFHYTRFVFWVVLSLILWSGTSSAIAQKGLLQNGVADSQEMVIDMESYIFTPSEVRVNRGQMSTLILRNQSFLVPHNFLLDDPHGIRILEADISSGESQTHVLTLTETGIYPFYCDKQLFFFPSHREEGMEGRLIVQ